MSDPGWVAQSSGQPLSVIVMGVNYSGKYLWLKQTGQTSNTALTPRLHQLAVNVDGTVPQLGSRVAEPLDLSRIKDAASSRISWDATVPVGTSLSVSAAINNSAHTPPQAEDYMPATLDDPIPGIATGADLAGKYLWVKVELTPVGRVTPVLYELCYEVNGEGSVASAEYTYVNDRLSSILHNGFSYGFGYDSLGNRTAVSVAGQSLVSYDYEPRTGRLNGFTYGNGQTIGYEFDILDRVSAVKFNDSVLYRYAYDASGNVGYHEDLVNSVSYRYHYDLAERLVRITDTRGNATSFDYDPNNNLNGTEYYYIRNAQNDIIGLFDGSGEKFVSYTYDNWGKLIAVDDDTDDDAGLKNPYRYRGYRYDTETGFYYLQSRYYNPEWGRFLNGDAQLNPGAGLIGFNMFAYCNNNPVNMTDPRDPWGRFLKGSIGSFARN